ncbi:MAG: hypothetical protein F6J93_23530 [Oscillatoria sp. SIO1A7]|nr:hypothetical protein [Oscillatoria sp. SIO1A7]
MVKDKRRIISAGNLGPHSACSLINPGALYRNNEFQLLCRGEPDETVWFGDFLAHQASPLWCTLDKDLNIKNSFYLRYPELPKNSRPEDWRLFEYRGKLYANHSIYMLLDRENWIVCARPGISEIDLKSQTLRLRWMLEPPFDPSPEEKNWSFFVYEGSLMCLYSFKPYIILQVDLRRGTTKKILEANPDYQWYEKGAFIGNSTNLVSWDDDSYIMFVHDFLEPRYGQRDRAYMQYGVLISKHTLLPTNIITRPLIMGGDESGRHPGVHYTSALVNRDDGLYAFYGEGDSHTGIVIFNKNSLNELFSEYRLDKTKNSQALIMKGTDSSKNIIVSQAKKRNGLNWIRNCLENFTGRPTVAAQTKPIEDVTQFGIMKGIDSRKGIIVSYPRSGLNWVRYCIEYFTGLRTAGQTKLIEDGDLAVYRTHNVKENDWPDSCSCPFYDEGGKPIHRKVLLLLRDYRESFLRVALAQEDKVPTAEEIRNGKIFHFRNYFENLKAYDEFSGQKMVVYYPDIISDLSAIRKILDFFEFSYDLTGFDLEYHRQRSIQIYDDQHKSYSKENLYDFSFHQDRVDPEVIEAIEKFVDDNYRDLVDRYLL